MKIHCDSCGAKYAIADDKVRGKVFKIRCKKCSHIIVVRGDGGTEAPSAAQDLSGWHIVVGRQQVGPMDLAELRARCGKGEVTKESFVWRQGLTDWVRLAEVQELADVAAAAAADRPAEVGAAAESSAAPLVASATVEDSVERGQAAAVAAAPAAESELPAAAESTPQPGGGADLFAGVAENAAGGAAASSSASEGGAKLTGQRGENSVLFSLSNLQAMAAEQGPAGAAEQPVPSNGANGKSGSGLIDINAIAGQTVSDEEKVIPGTIPAAPVLMPSAYDDRPPWLIPLLAVGGVIAVGLITLVMVLIFRGSDGPQQVEQAVSNKGSETIAETATASAPSAVETEPQVADNAKPAAAEMKQEQAAAQANANQEPEAAPKRTPSKPAAAPQQKNRATRRARSSAQRSSTSPKRTRSARRRAAVASSPVKPSTRAKKAPEDDLSALIDGALSKEDRQKAAPASRSRPSAPKYDDSLPKQLSPNDIKKGMRAIRSRIQACHDRYGVPGIVNTKVRVGGDGRVDSCTVSGQFNGTPTGKCVIAAVKRAKFPRFGGDSMVFSYPFVLN